MTHLLAAPQGALAARRRGIHGRSPAAAVLAIALALVAAACGAGGSGTDGVVSLVDPSASPAASGSPAASIDPEEAMLAFTRCMREHGVDIQVSTVNGGGAGPGTASGPGVVVGGTTDTTGPKDDPQTPTQPDMENMNAANEACRDLLPAGGMGGPGATMDPAFQDQMLQFAQCMRDHGIDFPDPQFNGGGMSIQVGGPDDGGIDPSSDEFQQAQKACGTDLPGGGGFVAPAPVTKP